jgi:hypothetical protein
MAGSSTAMTKWKGSNARSRQTRAQIRPASARFPLYFQVFDTGERRQVGSLRVLEREDSQPVQAGEWETRRL